MCSFSQAESVIVRPTDVDAFLQSTYVRGFDEMYLVPINDFHKVDVAWDSEFTTDVTNFCHGLPLSLEAAMDILSASRFVADGLGFGLNIVCDDETLFREIEDRFPAIAD